MENSDFISKLFKTCGNTYRTQPEEVLCLNKDILDKHLISEKFINIPRGWKELCGLGQTDKIEFTHAYWSSIMGSISEEPDDLSLFDNFFYQIEEIQIFAFRFYKTDPLSFRMIYILKDNDIFFQGKPPATKDNIEFINKTCSSLSIPESYLTFLRIHDGFSKFEDGGIISSKKLPRIYQSFQYRMQQYTRFFLSKYNISKMIPFYEFSEPHKFQCFILNSINNCEKGNLIFSELQEIEEEKTFEQLLLTKEAFYSFKDWLVHYLEH